MKKTLRQIVEEIKKSKFECEACHLENFVPFIELESKANDVNSICCLGKDHPCMLNVNDGYCCADVCQYKVNEI